MAAVESVTQLASQYFASPIGLAALAGLIPLIIFYMVRPQPEEQIMPSMMFFMKQKESGAVSQAIDRLMSNLILLLNILLVIGMAAAIAQPLMSGLEKPENSVIVFDRSASMENDFEDAKQFANSNLGKENTVILVDENVNVALEGAAPGEARSLINNLETRDVETDIREGLETAQGYEGDVFIASDLSQTVNSDEVLTVAEDLQTDRSVQVMETEQENKWGIVEVQPSRNTSTLEIENFMERDQTVTLTVNERVQEEELPAGEVKQVEVDTSSGQTTASLEEDPVTSDNTAYISIPGEDQLEVVFIADEENRYFREAVRSIPETSYEYRQPPIEGTVSGDIFVVGETNEILQKTVKNIDTQVENGKSAVLFGQAGLNQRDFDSAPAELGPRLNTSVEIQKPLRTTIGATEIYETSNVTGESFSDPNDAIIRRDYGQGEVLLYNIQDEDFRFDFLYPVFWNKVFQELSDTPSVEESNIRTGSEITGSEITDPEGETYEEVISAYQSGFYETPGQTYGVNMESSEESGSEPAEFESKSRLAQNAKQNVQHFAVIILALLVLLELMYLMWLGEL